MKENGTPSKVWLISQGQQQLGSNVMALPIVKEELFTYKPGQEKLMLPVGYIIEHEDGSSWDDYGDGFAVKNNIVSRPIYTGVQISHLEGELLTIIDAAFTDKSQCESIKSLVRKTLWGFNSRQERKLQEMFKTS